MCVQSKLNFRLTCLHSLYHQQASFCKSCSTQVKRIFNTGSWWWRTAHTHKYTTISSKIGFLFPSVSFFFSLVRRSMVPLQEEKKYHGKYLSLITPLPGNIFLFFQKHWQHCCCSSGALLAHVDAVALPDAIQQPQWSSKGKFYHRFSSPTNVGCLFLAELVEHAN